jgi:hypothetical protein
MGGVLMGMVHGPSTFLSTFLKIARSFTVSELMHPIHCSPDATLEDVYMLSVDLDCDPQDMMFLVSTHGYVSFDELEAPLDRPARSVARPPTSDMTISADTSLLDAVPLFMQREHFFILEKNDLKGTLAFRRLLDSPQMKLCLFALILELEQNLIFVLQGNAERVPRAHDEDSGRPGPQWIYPEAIRHLSYLNEGRLEKARQLCDKKRMKETPQNLLRCTTLVDKMRMLIKDTHLLDRLSLDKAEIKKLFNRLELVRNQIAHADSLLGIMDDRMEFVNFYDRLLRFTMSLVEKPSENEEG